MWCLRMIYLDTATVEKTYSIPTASHAAANPGLGAAGEANSTLGQHLVDFWTNVCICQSLIIEDNPKAGGLPIYQVSFLCGRS